MCLDNVSSLCTTVHKKLVLRNSFARIANTKRCEAAVFSAKPNAYEGTASPKFQQNISLAKRSEGLEAPFSSRQSSPSANGGLSEITATGCEVSEIAGWTKLVERNGKATRKISLSLDPPWCHELLAERSRATRLSNRSAYPYGNPMRTGKISRKPSQ